MIEYANHRRSMHDIPGFQKALAMEKRKEASDTEKQGKTSTGARRIPSHLDIDVIGNTPGGIRILANRLRAEELSCAEKSVEACDSMRGKGPVYRLGIF